MSHLHNEKKQRPKQIPAADSPHYKQEGIASATPPPLRLTADPVSFKKEDEEKDITLQKKENNQNFAGDDSSPPPTPPNSNENILTTLQRKHNAYGPPAKEYKRFELPKVAPKQFKQFKPFQLKDSVAYQRSQGELPEEVQAKMENTMGHDFSNVNIHKNSQHATDAGALAYAQGNDVHFAPGQFKPDTTNGQELIGHELAHVVQQREGRVKPTKMLGKGMSVNDDPGLEKEADEMGRKAAGGRIAKSRSKSQTGQLKSIRQFVLDADDLEAIVVHLHDAFTGAGTDEELVFVNLQKLNKNATEIASLTAAYQTKYSENLISRIRSEMSDDELILALEMIGIKDDPRSSDLIGSAPSTTAEYEQTVRNLESAMEGPGTEEEQIYAALIPFDRNATSLTTLKTTYLTETSNELKDDLESEMSAEELSYALYLLNAPPPATTANSYTVGATGTEEHAGTVPGGDVSVRTGDTLGGESDWFSMGYEGGLANESRWLQFIWREIIVTDAAGEETRLNDTMNTSGGGYSLTEDPSSPVYNTDTAGSDPFYESAGASERSPDSTTIHDLPGGDAAYPSTPNIGVIATREFARGATQVVSRAHFNTFLIRDYTPIHQVQLTVEWTFASATIPPRVQTVNSAGACTSLPSAMREKLIEQYPNFSYIR